MSLIYKFILCLVLFGISPLQAQTYPQKPVRVIVPFPAGGIVDILTRSITEKIASNWGTPIIVEARPGAGALIGTEAVFNSPPDGYTFLVASITGSVGPIINPQFKYDLRRDFTAVGMFATAPNIAVVPTSLSASSVSEIVAMARKNPTALNYAHTGAGSTNHLPVEFLKISRNVKITPVIYKGQPQAITDVISGQVQLFFGAPALLVPHVKAGKAKCLLLTSAGDNEALPAAKGLDAIGLGAEETVLWWGLFAPAGLPEDLAATIEKTFSEAAATPKFRDAMEKLGGVQRVYDAKKTGELVRSELAALGEVAEAIGLKKN